MIQYAVVQGSSENSLAEQICSALEGMKLRKEKLIFILRQTDLIATERDSKGGWPVLKQVSIFYEKES